jgi:hypothetical protein
MWVVGAAIIGALLMVRAYPTFDASLEDMCTRSAYTEWIRNCAGAKQQIYASVLPILLGLWLVLRSVLYAAAAVVCRSICRHVSAK